MEHPHDQSAERHAQPYEVGTDEGVSLGYGGPDLVELEHHAKGKEEHEDPQEDPVERRVLPRVGEVLDPFRFSLKSVELNQDVLHLHVSEVVDESPMSQTAQLSRLERKEMRGLVGFRECVFEIFVGDVRRELFLEHDAVLSDADRLGPLLVRGVVAEALPRARLPHGVA